MSDYKVVNTKDDQTLTPSARLSKPLPEEKEREEAAAPWAHLGKTGYEGIVENKPARPPKNG